MQANRAAVAILWAGEGAAFRALVDRLLGELDPPPASPIVALLQAWPALTGPTTSKQANRLKAPFDDAVARLKRRPDAPAGLKHAILVTSGAALVRAGRHAEAVARLEVRKHRRGPKRPQPKQASGKKVIHVPTARQRAERKKRS
jgi:hypothetical protein